MNSISPPHTSFSLTILKVCASPFGTARFFFSTTPIVPQTWPFCRVAKASCFPPSQSSIPLAWERFPDTSHHHPPLHLITCFRDSLGVFPPSLSIGWPTPLPRPLCSISHRRTFPFFSATHCPRLLFSPCPNRFFFDSISLDQARSETELCFLFSPRPRASRAPQDSLADFYFFSGTPFKRTNLG